MKGPLRSVLCAALLSTAAQAGAVPAPAPGAPAPAPAGCTPLSGGTDTFPSTAKLVLQAPFFGQPFVVRLSSSGQPDAQVQRQPQVGSTIDTQLLSMQLTGFDTMAGAITLRRSPTQPAWGQIRDVVQNGTCAFAGGSAFFDVFVEIDIGGLGETWINQTPLRLSAELTALPPKNVAFEIETPVAIQLINKATLQPRGQLFYAEHRADPSYPAPGSDCFDSLLSANVKILSSGMNSNIFGFGPSTVARGPQIPGGYCQTGGAPCQTNANCGPLNTCVGPHVDTELTQMTLGGFDTLLGNFTVRVAPSGTSDCCASHVGGGCTDPSCEQLVCAQDSFCCTVQWDALCASLAQAQPACVANCINPNAGPSLGKVQSNSNAKTYPASSFFDVFVEVDSSTVGGLHTTAPIKVNAIGGVRNLPPDPQTIYRYTGPAVTLYNAQGNAVAQISAVDHTVQTPLDCAPPPGAAEACLTSRMAAELTLPGCPTETLTLQGDVRVLRGQPYDPVGFGSEVIDAVAAQATLSGTGPCVGPVTLHLSDTAASGGQFRALTPEEFFPAESFFDLRVAIEAGPATLTGGAPVHMATTLNGLPPAAGETFFGPGTPISLLDSGGATVGSLVLVSHEIVDVVACPASGRSRIVFPIPDKARLDVSIPGGGPGVVYDVVRGDLAELHTTGGSFSSAACLSANLGPLVDDPALPATGAGFYYVARDGFQAFNGTWNSLGPAQQGDRDVKIGSCP